jgi:leucyl-tRNA synthetase
VELPVGAGQAEAVAAALANANVVKHVGAGVGPEGLKKVIYVPGKILNLIAPPPK